MRELGLTNGSWPTYSAQKNNVEELSGPNRNERLVERTILDQLLGT